MLALLPVLCPVVLMAVDNPSAPRVRPVPADSIRIEALERLRLDIPAIELGKIDLKRLEGLDRIGETESIRALVESLRVGSMAKMEFQIEPFAPLPNDSIHAVEITIDPIAGVTVLDRDGKRYHIRSFPRIPAIPEWTVVPDGGYVDRRDVVHIGSDVSIDKDEVVDGDVICIFGDVSIEGRITGTAVSVFGNVDVDGTVGGDAIAPFGRVRVGRDGRVRQSVVAIQIRKEAGGRIGGMRNEIFFHVFGDDWRSISGLGTHTTLSAVVLLKTIFWLFLALLAHALACPNVVRVKRKIQSSPIKSFFIGLLAQVLFLPALLILLVTIIGIPVAIFILPLMVVAALVLATTATGLLIGEKINENTGIRLGSSLAQTITGLLLLQSIPVLAVASSWLAGPGGIGGPMKVFTIGAAIFSVFLGYVVFTVGSGSVILTRFGTRPKGEIECETTDDAADTSGESTATTEPTPLPSTAPDSSPPSSNDPGTAPAIG